MGNNISIKSHVELYNDRGIKCLPVYFNILHYIGINDKETIRSIIYVDKTRHYKFIEAYKKSMLKYFYNPFGFKNIMFNKNDLLACDKVLIYHILKGNIRLVNFMINHLKLNDKIFFPIRNKSASIITNNKNYYNSHAYHYTYSHTILTALLTTNKDNYSIHCIKKNPRILNIFDGSREGLFPQHLFVINSKIKILNYLKNIILNDNFDDKQNISEFGNFKINIEDIFSSMFLWKTKKNGYFPFQMIFSIKYKYINKKFIYEYIKIFINCYNYIKKLKNQRSFKKINKIINEENYFRYLINSFCFLDGIQIDEILKEINEIYPNCYNLFISKTKNLIKFKNTYKYYEYLEYNENTLYLACFYKNNDLIKRIININKKEKLFSIEDFNLNDEFRSYLNAYIKINDLKRNLAIDLDVLKDLSLFFNLENKRLFESLLKLSFMKNNDDILFFILECFIKNKNSMSFLVNGIKNIKPIILTKLFNEKVFDKKNLSLKKCLKTLNFQEKYYKPKYRNINYKIIIILIKNLNSSKINWDDYFNISHKSTTKKNLTDFLNNLYDDLKLKRNERLTYLNTQSKESLLEEIKKTIKIRYNKIIIPKKRKNNLISNNNKKMRV